MLSKYFKRRIYITKRLPDKMLQNKICSSEGQFLLIERKGEHLAKYLVSTKQHARSKKSRKLYITDTVEERCKFASFLYQK